MIKIGVYGFWKTNLKILNDLIFKFLFPNVQISLTTDINQYNKNDINFIGDWFLFYNPNDVKNYLSTFNLNIPAVRFSWESELTRSIRYKNVDAFFNQCKYKFYMGYFNRENSIYFPSWISFVHELLDASHKQYDNFEERYENWICDMTVNTFVPIRERFYKSINSKRVKTAYGHYDMNDRHNKLEVLSHYLFNACFENTFELGYITEKPVEALMAGCIPIYNGIFRTDIPNIFNVNKMHIVDYKNLHLYNAETFRQFDKMLLKDVFQMPMLKDGYESHLNSIIENLKFKL